MSALAEIGYDDWVEQVQHATLLTKSSTAGVRDLGRGQLDRLNRLALAGLVKVGPKGYIHGWIFVGPQAVGARVFHPQHGHGTVARSGKRTATVHFDSGHRAAFEHGTCGAHPNVAPTGEGHFAERTRKPAAPRKPPVAAEPKPPVAEPKPPVAPEAPAAAEHPQKAVFDKLLGGGPGEGMVTHKQTRQIIEQMEAHGWKLTAQNRMVDTTAWEAPDGRTLHVQFITGTSGRSKPRFYSRGDGSGDLTYKAALAHVVTPTHEEVSGPNVSLAAKRVSPDLDARVSERLFGNGPGRSDSTLDPLVRAGRELSGYGGTKQRPLADVVADLRSSAAANHRLADQNREYDARLGLGVGYESDRTRQLRERGSQFEAVAAELEKMDAERKAYEAERDRRAALPLDIRPTDRSGTAPKPSRGAELRAAQDARVQAATAERMRAEAETTARHQEIAARAPGTLSDRLSQASQAVTEGRHADAVNHLTAAAALAPDQKTRDQINRQRADLAVRLGMGAPKPKPATRVKPARELEGSTDPKDNGAKINALLKTGQGHADLYRRVTAGPSGQTSNLHVGRLRPTHDGPYDFAVTDTRPNVSEHVGYLTRSNRNGQDVYSVHSVDHNGAIRLEGWTPSAAAGADMLVHGRYAAFGRHDSRRTSSATFTEFKMPDVAETAPEPARTTVSTKPAARVNPAAKVPAAAKPRRAGEARRGDLYITQHTVSDYGPGGTTERTEYQVHHVTGVTRDGRVKAGHELAWSDDPRDMTRDRIDQGWLVPGDTVDIPAVQAALRAHTYPGSTTPMAHTSLDDVKSLIRPHTTAHGATARPAMQGERAVMERIASRTGRDAQMAQLDRELSRADLPPDVRRKLEAIRLGGQQRQANTTSGMGGEATTPAGRVPLSTDEQHTQVREALTRVRDHIASQPDPKKAGDAEVTAARKEHAIPGPRKLKELPAHRQQDAAEILHQARQVGELQALQSNYRDQIRMVNAEIASGNLSSETVVRLRQQANVAREGLRMIAERIDDHEQAYEDATALWEADRAAERRAAQRAA